MDGRHAFPGNGRNPHGIFMRSGAIDPAMTQNVGRSVARIIRLDPATRSRAQSGAAISAEVDDSLWPEVSSRYALEDPTPMNPENRAGYVLSEIAFLFGMVGVFIFAVWEFLPGGISP